MAERFHKLSIVSELAKLLCLFLKNSGDGFNRIASFKLLGEGMLVQFGPRLDFVVLESSAEDVREGGGCGGLAHIRIHV
jgi:hypothetical protein